MRSGLALVVLGLVSLIAAKDGRGDNGRDVDGDDSATANSTTTTTSNGTNSTGVAGDSVCMPYMCISGIVNGSNVQYTLQSTGLANLGWMAMGFGNSMANTPMVVVWPNSDGTFTLSQRKASGEVMPTVDSNPPRTVKADNTSSNLSGSNPKMAFTIPADSNTGSQTIIWAFGTTNPKNPSASANFGQHVVAGSTQIDLSKTSGTTDPALGSNSSSGAGAPLLPFQKLIVAHALLCTIGFLMLLPAGALLARYTRTFTNTWFQGHWIFQFALAGPVIVVGVALGFGAVSQAGAPHVDDDHKRWGVGIFVLYIAQLVLGAVVHWVKPKSWVVSKKRPVQNYFHAVFGIIIIGLAFYQVHSGYDEEWPETSGRPPLSNAVNIVWYIWVVLIPVLYLAGLAFLPKQLRQERPIKETQSEYALREGYRDVEEPRYSDRGL